MRIRSLIASVAMGLALGVAGIASGAGLSYFTTPLDPGNAAGNLNTVLQAINTQVGSYLAFDNASETGWMALPASTSWAANGSTATGLTSVGPTGSHTTVQRWLIVVDYNGNKLFLPAF